MDVKPDVISSIHFVDNHLNIIILILHKTGLTGDISEKWKIKDTFQRHFEIGEKILKKS